ncbi:unnamed protein product [Scytosiphon promiscuus]
MEGGRSSVQTVQGMQQARERRRSSISLAIPICAQMAASVDIGADQVEFEAHGVKISHDGLFIDGNNVSEIHQDDLRVLSELGRGACSVVKQAQHVETRKLYAIKVFGVFDRDKRAQLLKEVQTLWGMECPSLIDFVGGYLKDGSIHVVLEYMDRGSLGDVIHDWRGMEYGEDLMAAITLQILWGLGYLHYEHHVHRDVKPQNILLNSNGEVKLSDFGIARELEGETDLAQTMVGTIRYMSPERLAGTGYGVAADVWSLGVVLLEMAARRLPFENAVSQIELHDRLEARSWSASQERAVDDLVKLVPGHSPEFEEVLRGCLQAHPEERLRPEELLELEWFARESTGSGGEGVLQKRSPEGAVRVVREYIVRAVEGGMLVPGVGTDGHRSPTIGGGGVAGSSRRDSSGGGMIQTMRSDGDFSDSDTQSQGEFGSDPTEDFGGVAGFRQEEQESSNSTG